MTTLVADLEADGLLDTISQLWQISTIDIETGERTSYNNRTLSAGAAALEKADRLIMHNGLGYDLWALAITTGVRLDPTKIIDTLVLSKLGNPTREGGHSLEAWAPRLGRDLAKVGHEDWSQWSPEMEYRCGVDCEITYGVYERLAPMYDIMPDAVHTEHVVAFEVARTIQRGFTLDEEYTTSLLGDLMAEQEGQLVNFKKTFPNLLVPSGPPKALKTVNSRHPLHGQLDPGVPYTPLKVEEFSPTSRQQIARRLVQRYRWRPTKFTAGGSAEVTEEILRDLPFPEAVLLADYLKTDKMIGQINAKVKSNGHGGGWLHHLTSDGRVHASLNPNRANTHRMSCSSPNLQQVSTDSRMRRAWIPKPGWKLVGVDAAGLELRCLAHYLAAYDGGEYARILLEGDVHSHVMSLIGFYDRNQTKRAEYGWLYGAGDAKLGQIALQDAQAAGKEIDYDHLGLLVGKKKPSASAVGRAIRSCLEEGINGLDELMNGDPARGIVGVKEKAKTGKLRGLDGRPLWVRSEHSALNLLLQSAGIIIVKKAWTMIDPVLWARHKLTWGEDYAVVMQVHDEFQIEAKPDVAELVGQTVADCITQAGLQLGFRCPTEGTYAVGDSWADTH